VTTINPIGREPGRRVRQTVHRGRDPARVRALVLLAALVLISAIAVWLIVRSDARSETPAASPCGAKSGQANAIQLRVLNATSREGLAGSVATELRKRGYTVTGVGNASNSVPGSAEIRHGAKGAPAARVIAGTVAGATVKNDARAGTDVDLVLGTKFRALAPVKPAVATSGCPATASPTGSPRR